MRVSKQTFGRQALFQRFVLLHQAANAGFFHMIDNHLKFAARFIQRYLGANQYLLAILWLEGDAAIAVLEHRRTQLRTLILQ